MKRLFLAVLVLCALPIFGRDRAVLRNPYPNITLIPLANAQDGPWFPAPELPITNILQATGASSPLQITLEAIATTEPRNWDNMQLERFWSNPAWLAWNPRYSNGTVAVPIWRGRPGQGFCRLATLTIATQPHQTVNTFLDTTKLTENDVLMFEFWPTSDLEIWAKTAAGPRIRVNATGYPTGFPLADKIFYVQAPELPLCD